MNTGGIFLVHNGGLVEMREQPYDTEAILQDLLSRYPNLLAGDQMDAAEPRRWLLVAPEFGIPDEFDGSDKWSLDHLFLDQDAIPTLVEVKRSSDPRIRREVVGQMLDYAANSVEYLPVEKIRDRFERECERRGVDPAIELRTHLGEGIEIESYWQSVKTNLLAEKIRLVFVADVIPERLKRIVEFLNGQMDRAEVLAVEIKQFVGNNLQTLVPRVFGQSSEADTKKGKIATKKWNEITFFEELSRKRGEAEVAVVRNALKWAIDNGLRIWWGEGDWNGSLYPILDLNGQSFYSVAIWTYGTVEVQFQYMKVKAPFSDENMRKELRVRLMRIPGVEIPIDRLNKRPGFPLANLANENALATFLDVLKWHVEQIKAAN